MKKEETIMSKEQFIRSNYDHFVVRSNNGWRLEVKNNEDHTRDFVWSKNGVCQLAAHVIVKGSEE